MSKKRIGAMMIIISAVTMSACAATGNTAYPVANTDPAYSSAVSEVVMEDKPAASAGNMITETKTIVKETDKSYTLTSGEDITISESGTFEITGTAQNTTIYVDTGDADEVTLLLSGIEITNADRPCIYIKNAGKVTVETADGTSSVLTVTDEFCQRMEDKGDAVIYSRDDLVLKGSGTLIISSSDNAIRSNDDLKIKSGTYEIDCAKNAFRANDEIEIEGGDITVNSCNDGIHAENNDDDTEGSILITGGTIQITATDDAIHATTTVQIDNGTLNLTGAEGIEGTQSTINGGDISISASDDGINAAAKSSALSPVFELNGGNIVIRMGAGDTDGVDSNGNLYINGGTIDITGQSTFDYDGEAKYTGGTIIENGTETNTITNQMMGGRGGFGGRMNGMNIPDQEGNMEPGKQDGNRMPGQQKGGFMPGQEKNNRKQHQTVNPDQEV